MKKTIRPILRDDLSRKGLEKRIDLRVYLDGRQTKFATPYSIAPACWDKKSGRVVGNCPEKSVINSYLNGKETEYERYLFQCEMLDETVDLERIREILTGKSRTAPSEKTNATLDEIFDAYVDKLRTDNRCERTIIGILDLKKDMAKFSKRSKKRTIDQFDILFIQEYKKYLRTVRRNADNTINTKLNRLRSVVKWAGRLGYPIDDPFGKGVRFLNRSTPRTIFLTKDEYDEFLQKALADRNDLAMRVTRELFIFSCETGLRFSDVLDLKWTHLKKDSKGVTYISKIQCKTKELVEIPLMSKWPKVLLAKYRNVSTGENVFPRLSNGCINRKLKMLAEKAGIGKCLSFHVARHTFASHLANAGVPLYIVAKLLGDKSLDMVHRVYTNTERTELTEAMKKLSA
ncbi:tyrosine-type recombinase/integrase [Alistipes shahii]|jgi:integrase|uniref:tyrosine-type recombinase/integrase n=1 Tax=Alistipes shahii TaxID=328814 RepID=UPI00307A3DFA